MKSCSHPQDGDRHVTQTLDEHSAWDDFRTGRTGGSYKKQILSCFGGGHETAC